MTIIFNLNLIWSWLEKKFKVPSVAELYLSKSIDRADFSYREKILQQKGIL